MRACWLCRTAGLPCRPAGCILAFTTRQRTRPLRTTLSRLLSRETSTFCWQMPSCRGCCCRFSARCNITLKPSHPTSAATCLMLLHSSTSSCAPYLSCLGMPCSAAPLPCLPLSSALLPLLCNGSHWFSSAPLLTSGLLSLPRAPCHPPRRQRPARGPRTACCINMDAKHSLRRFARTLGRTFGAGRAGGSAGCKELLRAAFSPYVCERAAAPWTLAAATAANLAPGA